MYAVIRTGGKQYKVAVGDQLSVEKLPAEAGQAVQFDDVLLVADGENVKVGTPTVEGALVKATVLDQERGPKIRIFKFKAKKRYRRRAGHKQNYTRVKIDEIVA
ncbi:ribosomal protein L21 [Thermobaculum terrenum ATCC BAA-798]|uniref:Large ribosomal subunit protein bL21 n=1 Tax=Thermobaculum terrenum (strain ATCC BAA-798 / CCMEE 7001 / YNP1) TaxID=525904 RepID=D1CEQ3_THET1|nr:50S ribosomal protein L21 [Thermobaculum terrenum]ACZ41409.1 ribosomal protein L21 [Thermobaculum terrenum ATCC BAA-798]